MLSRNTKAKTLINWNIWEAAASKIGGAQSGNRFRLRLRCVRECERAELTSSADLSLFILVLLLSHDQFLCMPDVH